jgi:hypothetical protein
LLIVVVEVYFDVTDTEAHDLRNPIDNILPVLFLRVEETILRALAIGIARSIVGNSWPHVAPTADAAKRQFHGRTHAQWLVVIGDDDPRAFRLPRLRAFP